MEGMAPQAALGHVALVTGGARRVGRALVDALAMAGADVVIHHSASAQEAEAAVHEIRALGRRAAVIQADLAKPEEAASLVGRAQAELGPIDWLVNSAAIFEPLDLASTTVEAWDRTFAVDLRAPFLLSQAFARERAGGPGAIVNILDWRALRPAADHFPYTIAKAGLAAMTRSLAVALAPAIRVNGLALGAILPPADGGTNGLDSVPAGRWARLEEVGQALLFLLAGPDYITGSILHLDGGRHLV
jgi:NAD(P)-dependent dehydrogenase (short-subunit alcohol dehydrogenase family)